MLISNILVSKKLNSLINFKAIDEILDLIKAIKFLISGFSAISLSIFDIIMTHKFLKSTEI